MVLSIKNMNDYLEETARKVAMKKCKNVNITSSDAEVLKILNELERLLICTIKKGVS